MQTHIFHMLFLVFTHIKAGIKGIEILCIQVILGDAQCLTKPLEMHDFPLAQKFNRFTDIRFLHKA